MRARLGGILTRVRKACIDLAKITCMRAYLRRFSTMYCTVSARVAHRIAASSPDCAAKSLKDR